LHLMLIASLTITLSLWLHQPINRSAQKADSDPVLTSALKNLGSADEAVRYAAWDSVMTVGQPAIPSLMALLRAMPQPLPVCSDAPADAVFDQTLNALVFPCDDASIRQRSYVIGLLAKLRAAQAVPLLIKTMRLQMPEGLFRYRCAELNALIEIGTTAVPELLKTLQEMQPEKAPANIFLVDEVRVIVALGEMGDPSSLEVLRQLSESPNRFLADFADKAISEILSRK
jgi:HEAT repeat protein